MEDFEETAELEEVRRIRKISSLKRENRRLRHSVSFQLGLHITDAVRKPWKLLFFPLTFPLLCLQIGMTRLGKTSASTDGLKLDHEVQPRKNAIVLFPTNGVGFGHFTRMYSVAREMRRQDPEMEIIFFTTMPTLHIPYVDDFATYHLAGKYKHNDMDSSTWNMLVEEMLTLVLETHNPKFFMFDGAFPYRGMLNSIFGRDEITRIWMRRGMFRKGSSIPVDSIEYFDLIVHPEDAVNAPQSDSIHSVETLHIPPITLLSKDEMLSREKSRSRLNLPLDVRVTYVQLGAGQINDIDSEIRMTIEALLHYPDMHIVLGESMLGERLDFDHERVHLLRDYPNSMYYNGFDFAVQAGGYNSFHEMRNLGIPTLFYPNMNTGMDDQLARCKVAVDENWGLVMETRNKVNIISKINDLMKFKQKKIGIHFSGSKNLVNQLIDAP
jgi:UDP-N-acetylglucosamine--N-acetylmuramyl-(pentapeptide) pyrophosphoryl-undecaprenol N-acetylglucosamine transferase